MSECAYELCVDTAKPLPDVLNTDELQVQQMRLGVLVLVAAIRTWEISSAGEVETSGSTCLQA